tara:strand:+ start:4143 stop:4550 length:408 start_codon:yes stop_codon:yes gene_type:complete
MQSIFTNQHEESAVAIVRRTMQVFLGEDGTPMVSFATNKGKGSGAQAMPVAEFREYVTTLQSIASEGIPEEEAVERSAAEMVRHTIKQSEGVISFRISGGKGSKPAKVNTDEFSEVVELLQGTVDAVEGAVSSLS